MQATTWGRCSHERVVAAMTGLGWLGTGGVETGEGGSNDFQPEGFTGQFLDRMRPDEGWASLPLVLLLAITMAWSISDARWILGQDDLTSFLMWIALAGALWGYVSARLGLSPWLAQALGCTIGAFVVIEAVGASLPGAQPGLIGWFSATAASVTQAYLDLTWRHQVSTLQVGHFCLLLGVIVWGTAQAAAYDIFGYHRAVNGVLLLAVVLIANMALTNNDQYLGLVIFSAAALVLLLLSHAADERSSWLRHRIWRGRDFEAPHMQGGLAFASVAVAGSMILTLVASSAPLGGAVNDLGTNIQNAFSGMAGLLPNGGASRYQGNSDFGDTATISAIFHEGTHNVFTVRAPTGSAPFHWRLKAYDTFNTDGWTTTDGRQDQVVAGNELDGGTNDIVALGPGRREVSITIHIQDTSIKHLVVADEPNSVSTTVQRQLVGGDSTGLNVAAWTTNATDYIVATYTPDISQDGTGLTEWRLQHAGTDYPAGLKARFTQGTALVGTDGKGLLDAIKTWAKANGNSFDNEFDVANAIQTYLHGSNFVYSTDITKLMPQCTGLSTVDCFAFIRTGFCEQYATTMTMLMRMAGYPARYVLGYLPGSIDPHTLVDQVTSQQKHAWVEVFFPTYGWITFDPTGGGVGDPTVLVPGSAVVASPTPSVSIGPDDSGAVSAASHSAAPDETVGQTTDSGNPPILLIPGILALIIALALFVLWRRRSRRLEDPEAVYRGLVKLASRLGYRPQPTQTVYEYTGMLADIVPQARDSLGVVATATVEVTYGKRQISGERLVFLATAQHSIRQALLGLALRVPKLRLRRRGPAGAAGRKGGSGRARK
jgi:transglutaminase-like putative cysteine protease